MERAKRVALGMSGGVDSSAAAAVLQHHGYEVVGVTCLFQHDERARSSVDAARAVCAQLGIEHVVRDCAEAFEALVVAPFVGDYAAGLTPSPCVGCNARMKIPEIMRAADDLGCAWVATGHYARVNRMQDSGRYAVLAGLDNRKDQSYMLCALTQDQLARLILPLGGMTKLAVRSFAADLGLATSDAPESQDICFAPKGYRALLAEHGAAGEPGDIVDARGNLLGRHEGLFNYTIGQRRGIGVSGPEPLYVIGRNLARNELVVGLAEEARIGWAYVPQVNWQALEQPDEPSAAMAKLRYRSGACPCIIEPDGAHGAWARLRRPQSATAPGQYAVFYQGAAVLGGGVIKEVGS